jgi:hypothetical protein
VRVRAWKLPDGFAGRKKPAPSWETPAEIRDISLGGTGILCMAKNGGKPEVPMGQRFRINMTLGALNVEMDGHVVNIWKLANDSIQAGVHFGKPEDSPFGWEQTKILHKMVNELQREEAKRLRGVA